MRTFVVLFTLGCVACEDPTLTAIAQPETPEEPCALTPQVVQYPMQLSLRVYAREHFQVLVAEIASGCDDLWLETLIVSVHQPDIRAYKRLSACDVFDCTVPMEVRSVQREAVPIVPYDIGYGKLALSYNPTEGRKHRIPAHGMETFTVALTPREDTQYSMVVLMLDLLSLSLAERYWDVEQYEFTPTIGSQIHIENRR